MSTFIDVPPSMWYCKDVEELMATEVNGVPFFSSIPFTTKDAVDYVIANSVHGQFEFSIPYVIHPTSNNPLKVYIDGVETVVGEVTPSETATLVKLMRGVPYGANIRFSYVPDPVYYVSAGANDVKVYDSLTGSTYSATMNIGDIALYIDRPEEGNRYHVLFNDVYDGYVDYAYTRKYPAGIDSTTVAYPSANLVMDDGYAYKYDPYGIIVAETVKYNGKVLKKVNSTNELTQFGLEYCIIANVIYVNYSLNNAVLDITVVEENAYGLQKAKGLELVVRVEPPKQVVYTNRFFPDVVTTRCELFVCMNTLRILLFNKYTDTDISSEYVSGASRFYDVQDAIDAGGDYMWWWKHLYQIEQLKLQDGSYVLQGYKGNLDIFMPITRAEMITIVERFRQWIVEAFK